MLWSSLSPSRPLQNPAGINLGPWWWRGLAEDKAIAQSLTGEPAIKLRLHSLSAWGNWLAIDVEATRKLIYLDHCAGWSRGKVSLENSQKQANLHRGLWCFAYFWMQNFLIYGNQKNLKLKLYFKVVSGFSCFWAHGRNKSNTLWRKPLSNQASKYSYDETPENLAWPSKLTKHTSNQDTIGNIQET